MPAIEWTTILQHVTSTVVIVGVLGFLMSRLFEHVLARDLEAYKAQRGLDSDMQLERVRTAEAFHATKRQRLANEVIEWSVPVLDTMEELERRLDLILTDHTWEFLDASGDLRKPGWSMNHDYMMSSALYSFGKYFCWMDLLVERLDHDFFDSFAERDAFVKQMWAPRLPLTWWTWERHPAPDKPIEADDVDRKDDVQVFAFQQRSLGEAMRWTQDGETRCLTYAEFLARRHDADLASQIEPLHTFLNAIHPKCRRWTRLTLFRARLATSRLEWTERLDSSMVAVTSQQFAPELPGPIRR